MIRFKEPYGSLLTFSAEIKKLPRWDAFPVLLGRIDPYTPINHFKDKMRSISLLLFFTLLIAGCGGGGSSDYADDSADSGAAEAVEAAPMGSASIAGMVSFDGAAPERGPVRGFNPDCQDLHDTDPLSDVTVVGESGGVQSAFVYVSAGLPEGVTFATPSEPAVLDQEGCMYTPHVLGVQVGQTIRIENSDPFQHNIHPVPVTNRGFNESTPNEGDYLEKMFLQEEIGIEVKCDVHPWMLAYVSVLDHPYFAVSDADGNYSIEGLPAGEYTVTAWHSTLGTQEMALTVGDGEAASAGFTFAPAG